jgi:glycosyltransferase involved in cell wall biosynthesis
MDVDVILASQHTFDMALRSPLTSHFEHVHRIPYGVSSAAYLPDSEKSESRRQFGIPENDFVLALRSTKNEFKGVPEIVEALAAMRPERPTTLLTVDTPHLLDALSPDYNIVDLGWVADRSQHARFLSACDVFLMPSNAEAFGLMAVEAMAAGRPVVCFEGTSLPEVTFSPECGIAVPARDSRALRAAIDALADDPQEARRRGELGRTLATEHYDQEHIADKLVSLYEAAIVRARASRP